MKKKKFQALSHRKKLKNHHFCSRFLRSLIERLLKSTKQDQKDLLRKPKKQ